MKSIFTTLFIEIHAQIPEMRNWDVTCSVQNVIIGAFILNLCLFRKVLREILLPLSRTVEANEQVRPISVLLVSLPPANVDPPFSSLIPGTRPLKLLRFQSIIRQSGSLQM